MNRSDILVEMRSDLGATSAEADAWSDALLRAARKLGFVGFAVWLPASDQKLHCRLFASTVDMDLFEEHTRQLSFAMGEGMPGRTWRHKKTEWIANVIKDDNFPRLRGAIRDLVRAVAAFPVIVADQPVAIVEMYSRQVMERDEEIASLMMKMGTLLGEFHTPAASRD